MMLQKQFDRSCHEHFSHLSQVTTEKMFPPPRLTTFDVEEPATPGGSRHIIARHEMAWLRARGGKFVLHVPQICVLG